MSVVYRGESRPTCRLWRTNESPHSFLDLSLSLSPPSSAPTPSPSMPHHACFKCGSITAAALVRKGLGVNRVRVVGGDDESDSASPAAAFTGKHFEQNKHTRTGAVAAAAAAALSKQPFNFSRGRNTAVLNAGSERRKKGGKGGREGGRTRKGEARRFLESIPPQRRLDGET